MSKKPTKARKTKRSTKPKPDIDAMMAAMVNEALAKRLADRARTSVILKVVGAKPEILAALTKGGKDVNDIAGWIASSTYDGFISFIFPPRFTLTYLNQEPESVSDCQNSGADEHVADHIQIAEGVSPSLRSPQRSVLESLDVSRTAPQADADGAKARGENRAVNPALGDARDEAGSGNRREGLPPLKVFSKAREVHAAFSFVPRSAPWWDWVSGQSRNAAYFTFSLGVQP